MTNDGELVAPRQDDFDSVLGNGTFDEAVGLLITYLTSMLVHLLRNAIVNSHGSTWGNVGVNLKWALKTEILKSLTDDCIIQILMIKTIKTTDSPSYLRVSARCTLRVTNREQIVIQ